ncbi:MAG: hypothetical protein DHS20C18_43280 [Saprospiraceae bacterium]|nr:MAG: hypothetical protein DHS20C18_43280 [Saprospiraceae bacterium]
MMHLFCKLIPCWLIICLFCVDQAVAQEAFSIKTDTIPGSTIAYSMVYLPGGTFMMGDPAVQIQLDAFWMATHELTHDEYRLFQVRENDSDVSREGVEKFSADAITRPSPPYLDFTYGMGTRGGFPAVSMTQQAALRYCQWLYQKTGEFYRLPTEAEWEYACKAGAKTNLPAGTDANQWETYGWFYENSYEKFHPVKEKMPNAWGIYDMLGNVSEWTLDNFVENYSAEIEKAPDDPWMVPLKKHSRTVRGGSYEHPQEQCTCTFREKSQARWQARDPQIPKSRWWNPDSQFLGFRLVKPAKEPTPEEVEAFFAKAVVD